MVKPISVGGRPIRPWRRPISIGVDLFDHGDAPHLGLRLWPNRSSTVVAYEVAVCEVAATMATPHLDPY